MKTQAGLEYPAYRDFAKLSNEERVFTPIEGYTLIVIPCRVTNARNSDQALWVGNTQTALADMEGESHRPIAYDFPGAPIQSKKLLPGAKLDFTIIFSVPEDTRLKDLIFTATDISEKGGNLRVSLRGASSAPGSASSNNGTETMSETEIED
jgi:hypothetical protein